MTWVFCVSSKSRDYPFQAKKSRKKAAFSSPQAPKSPASNVLVSLLPVRRATNIGIALRQFKCDVEVIVDGVLAMNDTVLPQPELLLPLLPTDEEAKELEDFLSKPNASPAMLQLPDRFQAICLKIPRRGEWIEIWSVVLMGESGLADVLGALREFKHAFGCLKQCCALRSVLLVLLRVGNFVNDGHFSGNAVGVTASSLLHFSDIKSGIGDCSLLHVVVKACPLVPPSTDGECQSGDAHPPAMISVVELALEELKPIKSIRDKSLPAVLSQCAVLGSNIERAAAMSLQARALCGIAFHVLHSLSLQLKQLSAGGKHMQYDAAVVSAFCARVDAFVERSRALLEAANALSDDIKLNGAAVSISCACASRINAFVCCNSCSFGLILYFKTFPYEGVENVWGRRVQRQPHRLVHANSGVCG